MVCSNGNKAFTVYFDVRHASWCTTSCWARSFDDYVVLSRSTRVVPSSSIILHNLVPQVERVLYATSSRSREIV